MALVRLFHRVILIVITKIEVGQFFHLLILIEVLYSLLIQRFLLCSKASFPYIISAEVTFCPVNRIIWVIPIFDSQIKRWIEMKSFGGFNFRLLNSNLKTDKIDDGENPKALSERIATQEPVRGSIPTINLDKYQLIKI
ncbi:MAG: hypothetical protein IJQ33_05070 [Clostridia bacterium]|nr:hypothetical protein [Clostridia bacterium]